MNLCTGGSRYGGGGSARLETWCRESGWECSVELFISAARGARLKNNKKKPPHICFYTEEGQGEKGISKEGKEDGSKERENQKKRVVKKCVDSCYQA